MEMFSLKKLIEVEDKEKYQIKIRNKFAAQENLDDGVIINRAQESIRPKIKISAKVIMN